MKPQFFLVPRDVQRTHVVRHHTLPNLGTVWHYHPELELHYIIRGEGVRFIGDNISNFYAEELLLIGADLPHMWRCNEAYFRKDPTITAEAVVVQFLPDFMGKDFLKMPEAMPLLNLYEKARSGLVIGGAVKPEIIRLMKHSVHTSDLQRVICILSMLELLSGAADMAPISSRKGIQKSSKEENDRLNKIYSYTLEHFARDLTLEEMAEVAHLSVTSFCRYFKKMSQKTFYDFLTEIRISHAQRLLIEDESATVEVIFSECGFNNRSSFFSHFKRITGCTPQEYKRRYLYENIFI